jgi:hypothetical protein
MRHTLLHLVGIAVYANGSSLALVYTYRRGQPGHVLKAAAACRGLSLAVGRTTANLLRFKVAPVTRRGGRRKAAVASAG